MSEGIQIRDVVKYMKMYLNKNTFQDVKMQTLFLGNVF